MLPHGSRPMNPTHRNAALSRHLGGVIRSFGPHQYRASGLVLWMLCRHRHNIHSTRHPTRLARDFGRKTWGDEGYAREELVAELGAAFLCSDLELATEPREENASYIANWLEVLKNDTRFIFKAAAHAQRAADYLRAFSGVDAATTTT